MSEKRMGRPPRPREMRPVHPEYGPIRAMRLEAGLSVAAFAALYGFNERTLERFEAGHSFKPSRSAVMHLRMVAAYPALVVQLAGARDE